jgi:hypothetical protein
MNEEYILLHLKFLAIEGVETKKNTKIDILKNN